MLLIRWFINDYRWKGGNYIFKRADFRWENPQTNSCGEVSPLSSLSILRLKIINIQKPPPYYSHILAFWNVLIYNLLYQSVQFSLIWVRFQSLIPCQLSFSFWARTSFSWSEPRHPASLPDSARDDTWCPARLQRPLRIVAITMFTSLAFCFLILETHQSENVWNDTALDW